MHMRSPGERENFHTIELAPFLRTKLSSEAEMLTLGFCRCCAH